MAKVGKNAPKFQKFRGNIFSSPLEYKNISSYIFIVCNIPGITKNWKKTVFLYNFPTISPTLHLSLFQGNML